MYVPFVIFAVAAGLAASAPMDDNPAYFQNIKRTKNSLDLLSHKKCGSSVSPVLPIALSIQPQQGYSQYAYREHEGVNNEEQARSIYEASAGGYGGGIAAGAVIGAGPTGPSAVGIFPQGIVSPCAKPMLLSCSPTVITGHLVEHQGYAAAPSYRADEEHPHPQPHHHHHHHETELKSGEMKAAEEKSW